MKKIGVVGAGMMGAEIALCFAQAGFETVLSDITAELAQRGKEKQRGILDKRVNKEKLTLEDAAHILSRVRPSADLQNMRDCDLIVEAASERLEIKQGIFRQLDEICKEETILASNTSSISITKLSASVAEPRKKRFIGMHFNSPASVMKLVEIIPALLTDGEVTAEIRALLLDMQKEPVIVKDVVGFGLNRIFHAMVIEACRLVEEGVCTPEDVDKICKYGLGHPMGVCKLLDVLSNDLVLDVENILFDAYGERFRPSQQLIRLVDAGRLGRKTGAGFYDY